MSSLFQDFGTLKPANAGKTSMSAEEVEDLKLHSFEGGFQAGWEEALKAQAETSSHVSEGLAASLQS
ncbi:MAG: ABC transporter ATP-binding protein, partial [Pseudomonadota bacterium]